MTEYITHLTERKEIAECTTAFYLETPHGFEFRDGQLTDLAPGPCVFPSPIRPSRPILTVKTAWKATLRRAGVPHFPIYTLRYVFCTRLSEVAPDAVVQRAMRHTSPET